jgi:hypothetical protein
MTVSLCCNTPASRHHRSTAVRSPPSITWLPSIRANGKPRLRCSDDRSLLIVRWLPWLRSKRRRAALNFIVLMLMLHVSAIRAKAGTGLRECRETLRCDEHGPGKAGAHRSHGETSRQQIGSASSLRKLFRAVRMRRPVKVSSDERGACSEGRNFYGA